MVRAVQVSSSKFCCLVVIRKYNSLLLYSSDQGADKHPGGRNTRQQQRDQCRESTVGYEFLLKYTL